MVFEYIECFYNVRRRHSALGYLSTVEYQEFRLVEEDTALRRCLYRSGVSPGTPTRKRAKETLLYLQGLGSASLLVSCIP
jgi:hypothetical protein